MQKAENILSFNAWVGKASGNVINFNNYLNGFVANNNVKYYKISKEKDIFTRIVGNKNFSLSKK